MANVDDTPTGGSDIKYEKREFDSANETRVFNLEGIKANIATLQTSFDDFADILKQANDRVISDVNVSCEHCVFGEHGNLLINLWKENASTFHEFNANFEKWSAAMAVITAKNSDFTNVASDIYNNRKISDNALTISATANGVDYATGYALREDLNDDNAIVGDDGKGNKTISYFDVDGNYIVKTLDANGNVIGIEKSYYTDDGQLVVEKYDAEGKTVLEKTTTEFDDFGRIVAITSVVGGVTTFTNNTYDENGRLVYTIVKDGAGNVKSSTENTYDSNGNLVKVETKENGVVTYSQETKYNDNGLVESVTTVENGVTTTESYEYSVPVVDADGNVTGYNSIVKTITTDDGAGNVTTATEVTTRQVKDITDADGNVVGSTTTVNVTTTDNDGNVTGSQETVTEVNGDKTTSTTSTYDGTGTKTGSTTTETTVTSSGSTQKVTTEGADGKTTSVETKRNANGSVTEVVSTDKNGNKATATPDGNVKYEDRDGKPIDNPGTFNDDGSLKDEGTQDGGTTGSEGNGEQPADGSDGNDNQPADGSEGNGEQPADGSEGNGEQPADGSEGNDNQPADGSDGNGEQLAAPTGTASDRVTVSSGQAVNINGKNAYFLMGHDGKRYYTLSTEPNAQVHVLDENGNLVPYTNYSNGDIVSRTDFVNSYRQNLDVQWNETFNNGTSPYTSVGTEINTSFTDNVNQNNVGTSYVTYDTNYLSSNKATLDSIDRGALYSGTAEKPDVIYLAPGQEITYDKPWDTYDNTISGGDSGKYLVYDSDANGYYVVNSNGSYDSSDTYFGGFISYDQLLDQRTEWKD